MKFNELEIGEVYTVSGKPGDSYIFRFKSDNFWVSKDHKTAGNHYFNGKGTYTDFLKVSETDKIWFEKCEKANKYINIPIIKTPRYVIY